MIKGECNCGAVQYEIDAEAEGIYACHCSICRRSTGSNGIAVIVVPADRFRWVRGESAITRWKKPGADWETWFCATCGSRVPGRNDPTTVFAPAGTITHGGDALRVIHHIWVGSRAAWDEIGGAGQLHAEGLRS